MPKEIIGNAETHRHIAAITLLVAFVQLYLLLVRVVPNTPIPVYINMFTYYGPWSRSPPSEDENIHILRAKSYEFR